MAKRVEKYPEVVYRKHPKPLSPHPSPWVRQPGRHLSLFIVLVFLSCGLIALDVRYGFRWLATIAGTLSSPVVTAVDIGLSPVSKSADFVQSTFGAREENERLREKVATLENEIGTMDSLQAENDRLRALLDLKAQVAPQSMAAEVMRYEDSATRGVMRLRGGTQAGLSLGQTVLSKHGQLLGRIASVTPLVATVQLITDPACRIGVAIERTGAQGILYSREGNLFIRVDRTELVSPGDRVVTSHLSDLYPKGLTVGTVGEEAGPIDTDPLVAVQLGLMKSYKVEPVFAPSEWSRLQEVLCLPNFAVEGAKAEMGMTP